MEKKKRCGGDGHVLALPYPSQGHINPMLQFCRRLVSKGLNKVTLATPIFISNTFKPQALLLGSVQLDTISDGFDDGGFMQADSIHHYLTKLQSSGSTTLAQLIQKHADLGQPFDCIVYDAFLPWALDVAKQFGIVGAAFFTQACAVNYIYYHAYHGQLPLLNSTTTTTDHHPVTNIPGLPSLKLRDMPSFIYVAGSYPAYFQMVLNQFSNVHKADWVLVNTFYKLEEEVVNAMAKLFPLITIGPTIPSKYLDNRLQDEAQYGFDLFHSDASEYTIKWLNDKPAASVIYASFGSMACLSEAQFEEIAWGLNGSGHHFLWAVRDSEAAKLPKHFIDETSGKGLIVNWSRQVEVLANAAVGCFFSHCGWNSTVEALSLGLPMVGMPQWTDQTTDAKFVEDVWKVGIRVRVGENGIVGRKEVEDCIREVMEGERGKAMKENAKKWRELAVEAVSQGGTSDINIHNFLAKLKIN